MGRNNLEYKEIDISTDPNLMDEMIKKAGGKRTIPQIFFEDHHVGGYQELRELEKSGTLLKEFRITKLSCYKIKIKKSTSQSNQSYWLCLSYF